jgi:hypothetical protein
MTMAKQPERPASTPEAGQGPTEGEQVRGDAPSATPSAGEGTDATTDDGAGSVTVDTRRAQQPTGTARRPQATGAYADQPVDSAVLDRVRAEGSGDAGSAERADAPDAGSVAEPGAERLVKAGVGVAAAYDEEARLFAEFLAWRQAQLLGAPEEVSNAASQAAVVERNQLGLGPEYARLLAAQPEKFVVTRQLGVSVYIPVQPPELTEEERKAGGQVANGLSRQEVVPYRSPLPQGTTHEQLQYLLTLGWVVPADAR